MLQPAELFTKTGEMVMEVLRTKHPETCPPTAASLYMYPDRPTELVPLDITNYRVTEVAGRLSGGAGPGLTDSVSLQHWLLNFGVASGELRLIIAGFEDWLSNGRPPWSAYQAMMSGQLIALDKQPGVRPFGFGETWWRLMAKCLLRVTGQEAKAACGIYQLSGGIESGIEGGIHSMSLLWAHYSQGEEWGFLLIDARNAFNEENRTAMLWAFCHEYTIGVKFTFY